MHNLNVHSHQKQIFVPQDTIKKMKRQDINWKKIVTKYISIQYKKTLIIQ